jgi:CHAT domain-containing protein
MQQRNALGSASLLHYAGHASYGGPDGMDSALSLAGGQRLTPADILALPRTPPMVTLFGCDTGRESASGAFDVLGLSTAFLVAGSRAVVATSRVIDDALARQVAGEFYRRLIEAPSSDPSAVLRSAVLSVRDRAPTSDWTAFRVLVP